MALTLSLGLALLLLGFVLPMGLAAAGYKLFFAREQSREPLLRTVEEFPGLQVERFTFSSNKGQKLAGYKYTRAGSQPQGVVIFSQGLGLGGHCYYMALAAYFTAHGFLFLTYDATGTDNSEGQNCAGLEQGVIDLARIIDYAHNDPDLKRYPITLLGHSWGAYCVCAVLKLHPEVKAVAAVSGFNRPSRLLRHAFSDMAGGLFSLLVPYMELIERFRFGSYADVTALEGFDASRADVLIIHSRDDANVPLDQGYNQYYAHYQTDPRFHFKLYEDRGHLFIFYTDAARAYSRKYVTEANAVLTEYGQTHAFDKKIGFESDQEFLAGILKFYQSCLNCTLYEVSATI